MSAFSRRGPAGNSWFDLKRCLQDKSTVDLTAGETSVTLRVGPARQVNAHDKARWTARLVTARECESARGWSYWVARKPGA
jgi:hypothetical protein